MNDIKFEKFEDKFHREVMRLAPGSRIGPDIVIMYRDRVIFANMTDEDYVVEQPKPVEE